MVLLSRVSDSYCQLIRPRYSVQCFQEYWTKTFLYKHTEQCRTSLIYFVYTVQCTVHILLAVNSFSVALDISLWGHFNGYRLLQIGVHQFKPMFAHYVIGQCELPNILRSNLFFYNSVILVKKIVRTQKWVYPIFDSVVSVAKIMEYDTVEWYSDCQTHNITFAR